MGKERLLQISPPVALRQPPRQRGPFPFIFLFFWWNPLQYNFLCGTIRFASCNYGLAQQESNPHRFLRVDFRPCFVIALGNTLCITCGQCRACTKIRSEKTAAHISESNVWGILDAENADLRV